MKKLVAILVVFGMLSSAIAITNANSVINESVKINEPAISYSNGYANVIAAMPYLHIAGYPMLPYKVKSIVLPAGSIVRSIDIKAKNVKEIVVDKKIQPAPEPVT
ncbi:MAG: hypothetical protein J7K95_06195, partial [Thermoplasmata archaeon]|nr:hypothetical protein [Thermoplasmata archaeon]